MKQNFQENAIILKITPGKENNTTITFFSETRGITFATFFGGRKSKLKSLISPYHYGKIWLHSDKVKKLTKITDFEVFDYHHQIRENLYKTWVAAFITELLIKTNCSGEYKNTFLLFNGFLTGISLVSEQESKIATLRFLWRYLALMGIQPYSLACGYCQKKLIPQQEKTVFYVNSEHSFFCSECIHGNSYDAQISAEALDYLQTITFGTMQQGRDKIITKTGYEELKSFIFGLITKNIETNLKTLSSGIGIL